MADKQSYWELLRDPRWQRKRLEVMERDSFSCLECGDDSKTLNVHHSYYTKGNQPWDYPLDCFKTLCDECHRTVQGMQKRIQILFSKLCSSSLEQIIGYMTAMSACENESEIIIDNPEFMLGVMDYYGNDNYDFFTKAMMDSRSLSEREMHIRNRWRAFVNGR